MGLPLVVSFTFTALFLKGHKQMGLDPIFAWRKGDSCTQADPCVDFRFLWLVFSLCASCLVWLVCPALHWEAEANPIWDRQACPLGNHAKTSLLTRNFQC